MIHIGERSLATILAALRNWQARLEIYGGTPPAEFLGHFDKEEPLSIGEVDALCESLNLGDTKAPEQPTPITVSQLANHILGREAETGEDFAQADLPMMGGCQGCGATVAAYNSCPSRTGYIRCKGCIGDQGFATVEEAKAFLFAEETAPDPFIDRMPCWDDRQHFRGITFSEKEVGGAFDGFTVTSDADGGL